jgi:hypothetical protein
MYALEESLGSGRLFLRKHRPDGELLEVGESSFDDVLIGVVKV